MLKQLYQQERETKHNLYKQTIYKVLYREEENKTNLLAFLS